MYKILYILIEGDDEETFSHRILIPMFEEKYDSVGIWKYAQEKKTKNDSLLKSIKARGAEYIYVTDINRAPCVTAKKQEEPDKFSHIDKDRIIVVIKEIESWYLAGLDEPASRKCGIPPYDTTDNITKEQFNSIVSRRFARSRIDFLQELLKYFQVEIAKQKNKSFSYFLGKHDCG